MSLCVLFIQASETPKDWTHCSLRDTEECSNYLASSKKYQWGKGTLLNINKTKERLLTIL